MKNIVFFFNNCINPKHSDLTISQIGIAGPIKWTYAFGGRDAEQEKVEYNNKVNEAVHNFEPVINALNESPAGDLSKSELEDICNRSGILFDDFERTFLALEKTFFAASKKLNYNHGHLFYEDSQIHCQADVQYNDEDIKIEFPLGYFGGYPSDIETPNKVKYTLLWSLHDVSDFSVEAYIKIFKLVLSEELQCFCDSTFEYANEGAHKGHVTSKFIMGLLSILIDYYEIEIYRLRPEYELGLWKLCNGEYVDLMIVPTNCHSNTDISDRIDKYLSILSPVISEYMRLKEEWYNEAYSEAERSFALCEARLSALIEIRIHRQFLNLLSLP